MATISNVEGPFNSSLGYGMTSPRTDDVPGGVIAAMIDTSVKNMASSDVYEAINIPAGAIVIAAGVVCLTAEGATATVDLGDGDDPDGFIDAANVNSAGLSSSSIQDDGTFAYSGGRYYSSDDTIDVTAKAALDAAKFVVWCKYILTNLN